MRSRGGNPQILPSVIAWAGTMHKFLIARRRSPVGADLCDPCEHVRYWIGNTTDCFLDIGWSAIRNLSSRIRAKPVVCFVCFVGTRQRFPEPHYRLPAITRTSFALCSRAIQVLLLTTNFQASFARLPILIDGRVLVDLPTGKEGLGL